MNAGTTRATKITRRAAEAELIADLAVLVDAGLVAVDTTGEAPRYVAGDNVNVVKNKVSDPTEGGEG